MAKYSNTISYHVQTTLDTSGIAKLQAEIRSVELELQKLASQDLISNKAMSDAQSKISQLRTMISGSFNANLGMLDMTKFSKQLQSSKTSLDDFRRAFSTAGAAGEVAFNNTLNRLTKLDTGLVSVSKTTDKLFNTIGNTVRWGIVASGFQTILNSAHQTVQYVRDLDTSLTNIMMVTQQSKEQMNEFAQSANDAAKALSSTTVNMTDAALVFAQQGFNTDLSSALAERSTKLANISQQDTLTTSDQITTIMNAYDFTGNLDQIDKAMDSWANVANVSAADVEELATAAQKAASTANTTGVTLDQLNAQIATIESVTREAPENIGNALKTIYSRFADISMGNTLEDGVDLGTIAETLQKVGVNVLNDEGKMNNVGDIMEQLMEVWQSLDQTEQNAISTVIAGRYQLSRFQALMNRSDLYKDYLGASENATGTADQMQDIYANSMEGRLNKLQATAEGIFNDIFNTDDFYGMIDALTTVLDLTNQWVDSIGGGANALQGLGAIATRVFSKNIAAGITSLTGNFSASRQQQQNLLASKNLFAQNGLDIQDPKNAKTLEYIQKGLAASTGMTTEQQEKFNETKEQALNLASQQADQEEQIYQTILATNQAAKQLEGIDEDVITFERDEQGRLTNIDASKYNQLVASGKLDPEEVLNQTTAGTSKIYNETEPLLRVYENLEKHLGNFTAGNEKITSLKGAWIAYGKTLKGVIQELGEASNESQELIAANKAIGKSFKSFDGTEESIQKIVKAIEAYGQKIREVRASGESGKVVTNQELGKMIGDYEATKTKKDTNDEYLGGQIQGFDKQVNIQSIVNAAGAVGELAFAWQSFQSLGSLWANSDTELGDKVLQTVMNLSINLPMLISSFATLNSISKSTDFSALTNSLQQTIERTDASVQANRRYIAENNRVIASSRQVTGNFAILTSSAAKANIGLIATAAKMQLVNIGAKAASVGVGMLNKALSVLGGPIGIALTLVASAIGGIVSAVGAANEEAYNSAKDSAQKAADEYNKISESVKSFDSLYEEYKSTGQTSSEFVDAAKAAAEALDVQGASALIAAGNYETLAQRIREADAAERESAETQIQTFLDGQNANSLDGNPLGIGNASVYRDFRSVHENQGTATAGYDDLQDMAKKVRAAEDEGSVGKAIGAVKNTLSEYNEEIADLNEQIAEAEANSQDTSALEKQRDEIQSKVQALSAELDREDVQDWLTNQEQLATLNAQDLNLEGMDYQGIVDEFFSSENGMSEYLEYLGSWSDQLQWMINNTTDETAKLTLQLEQAYITSGQMLQGKITDTINVEGIETSRFGVEDNTQYAQLMTESLQNQIKNSGLSRSEQLNFIATIDEDASLAEIQQQIDNINASDNLPKLIFEPTLTDRSDFSDEEISDLLSNTGMSESGFNRMVSSTFNSEGFQNEATKIEEEIKALRESGDTSEDTADKIAELRQEYEDLGDSAEDVSAYNLQMNKGVEDLVESWEDLSAILEDDVTKGTSDYYEALGQLDEIISDILNIDTGALSDAFYTDPTNLENIQRLAEGDVAALDDLREAAAQDLIVNLQVDNISDEDKSYLINNELLPMLSELQMQLDTMPLNTTVDADTSPFISKLNELLALGQITAEQATNILSSIGMEAHIVEEQSEPVWNETKIRWPRFQQDPDTGVIQPTGDYDEISMWTEAQSSFPVIQGATYTGAGVSTIGASSSGNAARSRGGSGGSGGGGGGSGKTYEPKTKDPIEDELDRYERVNTILEDAENRYERLNADRERLTGFDMADAMEEEVELLNRQIALHREKLEIQKEEAQELRDELSSQYDITFDAEGFITNYATTHDRLVNEVNSLINQYNNTTTEEGQEALEEQIEDAQDALDDFNETYQRYDELWAGDLQETLNTLEDLEDQIEDIRIEMMNTSIEAVDNLQDLQESLNEFNNTFEHFGEDTGLRDAELAASNLAIYFDIANESASSLYDTLIQRANDRLNSGLLSDDERQRIQQDIAMWENARKQIGAGSMEAGGTGLFDMAFNNMRIIQEQIRQYEETGTSTIFGENSADLYDAAKEAYDQATGLLSDFEGHYEDLHDAILDMIDETAEKIEKRREQYENITDELDHQREIIELIHGDEAYNELNMIYDAQNQNYLASINEMQQTLDYWKELRDQMEEGSEEWEAINEQIMDTQSELNDLVEESLDNLQEKYENTVNNILDTWTSNAFGGTDLDWVAEEWELINRNADYYLDDVNAAYETQKLQGKYLEMLDQTDDLHIQQMISEQMKQQLDYLREKDKLSEYDVAYANAQLEILQKRIALEEAQRNKSQMQLRRDSQGNYSYVYTADEGDVSAAEGDLLDAQNNAYNLSKEQMQQTQADSLSALQDAQQLLNDIWTNANLTLDEKTERTQTVIDSLKEYLAGTAEQLSESEKNIINDFIGMAEMMTDENGERIEDVLEQIKDGNLEAFDIIDDRWSTALSNWLLNLDDFNISTDDSFSQLIENSVEFQENVDSIASEVNQDFSDMGDTISKVTDQTKDLASATSDFINQLESDSGIILKYEDQLESMREKIADTTNEMRAYQQQVNQLQSDLTAKEQENANLSAEIDTLRKENESLKNPSGSGGGGGGSSFGGSGYSQSDLAWGIAQNIWTYGWAGGWGNDPTRSGKLTGAYGTSFARQVQDIINQNGSSGNLVNYGSDKFSSYSLIGYDTGGYTGSWSDGNSDAKNGKLAYLHQKELVLNAADTENILKAVDIVRQMVQTLKSSAVADTFSNIANSVSAQSSGETVEQNVHITAEFPAANSAAEIESALLSLNERAIQYSFRKK